MPTAKEVQRELHRREWEKRIAECESSNMSVREWCDANGINVNTYYGRVAALKKYNLKHNKLPVQEIVPLSAVQEQRICDICGDTLTEYTEEYITTRLAVIPEKVYKIEYYRKVYKCKNCDKNGIKANIMKAENKTPACIIM